MPWAGSRLENRPLSRRMHREKCRPLLRLASGAPVFANGAVTAAMAYAFNQLPSSQRQRRTFLDDFSQSFLEDFRETHPVEYGLFREYALSIDVSLWPEDSFRYMELAWRNFEAYAFNRSMELVSMSAQDLVKSLYGPQSMISKVLPGGLGAAFEAHGTISSGLKGADLVRVTEEAMTIRIHGPQVINENLFRASFRQPYDRNLTHLVDRY